MTTALQIIKGAYRKLTAIDSEDESASFTDAMRDDGLEALKMFIGSLGEGQTVFYTVSQSHTLTSGDGEYTIGSGGDIDTVWPSLIASAQISVDSIDYPLRIAGEDEYNRIPVKTTQGIPYLLYYKAAYPLGIIYLYYVPSSAYTLKLNSYKQLTEPTALSATLDFPRPYDRMLVYNLAIELSPELGLSVPPAVAVKAEQSLEQIERENAARMVSPVVLDCPGILPQRYNINSLI